MVFLFNLKMFMCTTACTLHILRVRQFMFNTWRAVTLSQRDHLDWSLFAHQLVPFRLKPVCPPFSRSCLLCANELVVETLIFCTSLVAWVLFCTCLDIVYCYYLFCCLMLCVWHCRRKCSAEERTGRKLQPVAWLRVHWKTETFSSGQFG